MAAKIITLWFTGAHNVLNGLTDTVASGRVSRLLDDKLRSSNVVCIPYRDIEKLVKYIHWRPNGGSKLK